MNNTLTQLVQIENISKTYTNGPEKLHILRDISLEIGDKSIVAITGESGSGKSTLLNLIGGLDSPSHGRISVNGETISSKTEEGLTQYRSQTLGFIFQFHYLLKDFTALENIMLPAFMQGVPRKKALEKAALLLEKVHLQDRGGHYPSQLSGGERQRIAVARSLVNDPLLVLADEPTGSLDEKNSRIVEELLFSLVDEFGKTLIIVTHDQVLAEKANVQLHLTQGVLSSL